MNNARSPKLGRQREPSIHIASGVSGCSAWMTASGGEISCPGTEAKAEQADAEGPTVQDGRLRAEAAQLGPRRSCAEEEGWRGPHMSGKERRHRLPGRGGPGQSPSRGMQRTATPPMLDSGFLASEPEHSRLLLALAFGGPGRQTHFQVSGPFCPRRPRQAAALRSLPLCVLRVHQDWRPHRDQGTPLRLSPTWGGPGGAPGPLCLLQC